jgi:hypothetical protein
VLILQQVMAAGFQLDQLLAACADLAKRTQQEEVEQQQQQQLQQCQAEQSLEALAEDSDDGDDLYADLQQPEGAITSRSNQKIKVFAHTSALCAAGLALFSSQAPCPVVGRRCWWCWGKQCPLTAATRADTAGEHDQTDQRLLTLRVAHTYCSLNAA